MRRCAAVCGPGNAPVRGAMLASYCGQGADGQSLAFDGETFMKTLRLASLALVALAFATTAGTAQTSSQQAP